MTKRCQMAAILIDGIGWLISSFPISMLQASNSSRQSAFKQTGKILVIVDQCIFRIVRNIPTFTVRAATAKLSNLPHYYNQKWNRSKPSFGHQKGECETDKTQQLTQESSLIIGGFSWASDAERSELQSYYEMISHIVKWFPDLLKKNVKESAKRIFRCQYICLFHLGV